jgi:hypothetical protein
MRRAAWILVGTMTLGGCGQSRLSPEVACQTIVDSGMRCGTYTLGTFGGTSEEDDVARCAQMIGLYNDNCQRIFSDAAMCSTRECSALTECQDYVRTFESTCSSP